MPCRYVIDKQRRLVISTCSGRLTHQEIKALRDQLIRDPDFDPTFDELADSMELTDLELSVEEAREIASQNVFSPDSRRAWVANRPAFYGMGRLIGTYHQMEKGASQVSMFNDFPSALKWLGLETAPDTTKLESASRAQASADEKTNKIA